MNDNIDDASHSLARSLVLCCATSYAWAMKEMNGRYIGNRPCKLKKSDWTSRNDTSNVKNKVVPKRKPMNKRKHLPTGLS